MKIGERVILDKDGMIIQKTHDATPVLERAAMAREIGNPLMSDAWHVGSLPAPMVYQKARDMGVRFDDVEGMERVIMALLNDRDHSKFRVKEGRV